MALAGLVYAPFANGLEDDPGTPEQWQRVLDANAAAVEGRYGLAPLLIGEDAKYNASMEARYGLMADSLLQSQNVITDEETRWSLIKELEKTSIQAARKLQRNAQGDYRPDPDADRFPEWKATSAPAATVSVRAILDGWEQEARSMGRTVKTIQEYRASVMRFMRFVGHDEPSKLTTQDVIRWKEKRLADGISTKTIKDADLAVLKSVFGWAQRSQRMPNNPVAGVTIRLGKKVRSRPLEFLDDEAQALLNAALNYRAAPKEHEQTAAAKKWAPWVCAYTGARVGEILQLRRQDVRPVDANWILTITPDAGPVKTKEVREVPLHPQVIELGFPEFVLRQSEGYLFGRDLTSLSGVENRLRDFVRTIVPDPEVAPNHAWRHRFVVVAIEAGIDSRIIQAICGHAPRTVGERYGRVTLKAKIDAIAKLPRYKLYGR